MSVQTLVVVQHNCLLGRVEHTLFFNDRREEQEPKKAQFGSDVTLFFNCIHASTIHSSKPDLHVRSVPQSDSSTPCAESLSEGLQPRAQQAEASA